MTTRKDKPPRRISANAVVAFAALLIALGGTALATSRSPSERTIKKTVVKRVLKGLAPKLSVKKAKKANLAALADKTTNATTATDAAALGGQPAAAFAPSGKVIPYSFRLPFGGQRNIITVGALSLTASCAADSVDDNGTPHTDFALIRISSTQNGAVFDASTSKRGGPLPTDFLNTDTPAAERTWVQLSLPADGRGYEAESNEDGAAQAPDGSTIETIQDSSGLSVNLPGSPGCTFHGTVLVDN